MLYVRVVIVVILSGFVRRAEAQRFKDTLRLKPVALSWSRPDFSSGTRYTSVDSVYLRRHTNASLAETLEEATPAYLKSYGNGMLSTISFRGTGAEHTAVLWNGFNINSFSLGLTDFSVIPTGVSDRVSLHHGSLAGPYGTSAIGGAVVLDNDPVFIPGVKLRVSQDLSSFQTSKTAVSYRVSGKKFESSGSYFRNRSANNFPYYNPFLQENVRQQNASIAISGLTQNFYYRSGKRLDASLHFWYNYADRHVQPSMGATSKDRRKDENYRVAGCLNYKTALGLFSLKGAYFRNWFYYNSSGQISTSLIRSVQFILQDEVVSGKNWRLLTGIDGQFISAAVTGYVSNVYQQRFSAFLESVYRFSPRTQVSFNLRKAVIPGYNPPLSPNLGLNWKIKYTENHRLELKVAAGSGYRVPTLNERFWPTGNPALRPEHSYNAETGLVHFFRLKKLSLSSEFTVFAMKVQDWILWRPITPITWTPVNINTVFARGIEFSESVKFAGKVQQHLSLNYGLNYSTVLKTTDPANNPVGKQLMYVPVNKLGLTYRASYKECFLAMSAPFTGFRYTDSDNTDYLSGYWLFNISAGKNFKLKYGELSLSAGINNLLNTFYQNYQNYAMPGRSFSVRVCVEPRIKSQESRH